MKRHNELSVDENRKSPLEEISRIDPKISFDNYRVLDSSIFILEDTNQSDLNGTPRWELMTRT